MKSLDLGCGLEPRGPEGWDHYGIDIVPSDNPNIKQADLIFGGIPFDDNTFGRVVAHDFVEHIPKVAFKDNKTIYPIINLWNEIYRVLEDNGTFYCFVPRFPTWGAIADPGHCCYSDDTEILTRDYGWIPIANASLGDYVLTLDLDSELAEYQQITQVHSYPFSGNMRHFKNNKSVDLLVTPNHNMVRATSRLDRPHNLELQRADWFDGRSNKTSIFSQYVSLKQEPIDIDNIDIDGVKYPAKEFMKFMGWFLAEGWTQIYESNYQYNIIIAQSNSVNAENCKEIISTMEALGLKPHFDNRKIHIIAGNKHLAYWLLNNCGKGAENKRIPSLVKNQNKSLLLELLKAAIKGDGYSRKDSARYSSVSHTLANDISEIAQLCGLRATQSIERRGPKILSDLGHSHVTDQKDIWHVFISKKDVAYASSTQVEYSGTVVSVGVSKYHTLYVRRNGRAMWSGNSFWMPESLNYLSGDYFGFHDHYGHTSRFEMIYCSPHSNGIHMEFELVARKSVSKDTPYKIHY